MTQLHQSDVFLTTVIGRIGGTQKTSKDRDLGKVYRLPSPSVLSMASALSILI
jgi:hypothetical protein